MATGPVLVTGAAGFIGHAVAARLLRDGVEVVGVDNFNAYYDPALKRARWAQLSGPGFVGLEDDLADPGRTADLFLSVRPSRVVHLAAQAGVRFSMENPQAYANSNLNGFLNVLEGARAIGAEHVLYASSSSIYGANTRIPYSESQPANHPLSLYAATKVANEAMAHAYASMFAMPMTGLRFFTVYGPWGRPDMAPILFARAILEGRPLRLFNHGDMVRDFTYIDDVVEGVVRTLEKIPAPNAAWNGAAPDPASSLAPWRLFNIGNDRPIHLQRFLAVLEEACGRKAIVENAPMQPGDVPSTHADISALRAYVGFEPSTPIEMGVPRLVDWVRDFYAL
jgi:UDP-glucuronate 4-epimerase